MLEVGRLIIVLYYIFANYINHELEEKHRC